MEYKSLTKEELNNKTRNFPSTKELHFFNERFKFNHQSRLVLLLL